jgi:hypothetical protein
MIDFPASPTVGQQFSSGSLTWVWDGVKWTTAASAGQLFLPLTGGTLTGNLVAPGIAAGGLSMKAASGQPNAFWGDVGGNARWLMELGDGSAETGANAGSNFAILAYSDSGIALGPDFTINRATGQVGVPQLVSPQAIGDNRVINGDMRIDQRNNGAVGTANGYTLDRWYYAGTQTGKGNWRRNPNGVPNQGFPYSLCFVSLTAYTPVAADTFYFYQPIEADYVSDFQWGTANAQPVTLSFWVQCTQTGTFGGAVSSASAGSAYPFTYSIPIANVWTKIAITIPAPTGGTWVMSGNGAAINLFFDLGSGANYRAPANAWIYSGNYTAANGGASVVATNGAQWFVTGVKLEIGPVATPFNRQSLAKLILDCQRYYQVVTPMYLYGYAGPGNIIAQTITFPIMRATPTVVSGSAASNNTTSWGVNTVTTSSLLAYSSIVTTGSGWWEFGLTMSAEL